MTAATVARPRPEESGANPLRRTVKLIDALRSPACYPHPAPDIRVIETHISYVLLAGAFAYKVKKPVALGFLDFSTLEARRHFCEEELRLNRRTTPGLYLEVVPIARTPTGLVVGAAGPVIDYAVKMRRFESSGLFDRLASEGRLTVTHVEALAHEVARLHAVAKRAPSGQDLDYGSPDTILATALDNFREIEATADSHLRRVVPRDLRDWTVQAHDRLRETFARRRAGGFVRECHGDLHLGNVVLVEAKPVLFDCIEFNAAFRWTDVMSDVAFVVMDLLRHDHRDLAARFLNAYLEETGDYEGLAVLRFYLVYRAMVRAKVALIRVRQADPASGDSAGAGTAFRSDVALARRMSACVRRTLILMSGVSGSGKTTVAERLMEAFGAVRVRSDVERKRMHGFTAETRVVAAPGASIYSAAESRQTYDRLAALAEAVLNAGYRVIVDATCLERAQRRRFRDLAAVRRAPFRVVECDAPVATLRDRIAGRLHAGRDASDADLAVLKTQLASREFPDERERQHTVVVDTTRAGDTAVAVSRFRPARHGTQGGKA